MIVDAEARMDIPQARLWDVIQTEPEKWQCPPWGDMGGGFWVVGLVGSLVLWYNDIEEGFNLSPWTQYGTIGEYRCSQDELEHALQNLLRLIETGEGFRYMGPPVPLA